MAELAIKIPSIQQKFYQNTDVPLIKKKFDKIEANYGDTINKISDLTGLDKNIIKSFIFIESGGDKYEGWDFVHLDFKNLDAEKVKSKYREVFELKEDEPIAEPYLFIFSHFS